MPLLQDNGMYLGGKYQTVAAAMRAACQTAQAGDRILVFGSFYTVAAAKAMVTDTINYGYSS